MENLKNIIKSLSEKTSKLQTVPQQKALEAAKTAQAASTAVKTPATGKA